MFGLFSEAHIELWYRCPVCRSAYKDERDAIKCRSTHPIKAESWAVGKRKSVRIFDNCAPDGVGGVNWALKEADLSDFIEERKRQLQQGKSFGEY